MCFYLLPFLALSRREVEELPAPPALPAWAVLPGLSTAEQPLGRARWLHRPWEQPGARTGLLGFLLQLWLRNQGLPARGGAGLTVLPLLSS